jgi:hypothetical protein
MKLLISLFSPAHGCWGGLTRATAIAETAKSMGHQVAFCASGDLEHALRDRDYTVYSIPTTLGLPAPLSRFLEQRSQRVSIPVRPGRSIGNIWLLLWMSGYARSGYLRRLIEAEVKAADTFRADRIFTDLDPGAFITAVVTGIPIAFTYAHILTYGSGTRAWRLMRRAIAKVLQSYRLPTLNPHELYFGESVLKIIPSIPELDDTDPDSSDVRYVGHLIGPIQSASAVDLQVEDGRRCVFVYVGTGSVSLNILQNVLPHAFPSNGDWSCFVGAQGIATPYQSGAVEFHPYIPAETLLPQCDWTICHGGQNTIIQSLLYGVPLIIFPGPTFERRYNARKVVQAEAGVMGEVNQFTVEWLYMAFERWRDCAPQAAVLGERLRSYGGPSTAVEAIMNWDGSHND